MFTETCPNLLTWRAAARRNAWRRVLLRAALALLSAFLPVTGLLVLQHAYLAQQLAFLRASPEASQQTPDPRLMALEREQAQLVAAIHAVKEAQCQQKRWANFVMHLQHSKASATGSQQAGHMLRLRRISWRHGQVVLEHNGPLSAINELIRGWDEPKAAGRAILIDHHPSAEGGASRVAIQLSDDCIGMAAAESHHHD